jgi:hypothetical protein
MQQETTMNKTSYPGIEEIRAIEREARIARSRELGRLLRAGARALKSGAASLFTINPVRVVTNH